MRSTSRTSSEIALPLRGAGGEPVDFFRTVISHGVAQLPPAVVDEDARRLQTTLRIGERLVPIRLRENGGAIRIDADVKLNARERRAVSDAVSRMFRLDDDLAPFYAMIADDPALKWAARGAGRMLASPSVFEDVIKTICTTNCAWSATVRMVTALVELGGGAFPSAAQLAVTPESWYRETGRMGYRGPYVRAIADGVARGDLDLERLLPRFGMSDADVEAALLALPGIGPYGAAHVMQLLGRHRRLIFDSWTRPKYLRLSGKKQAKDRTITRAFSRYGPYAGLAFWLYLTEDWE